MIRDNNKIPTIDRYGHVPKTAIKGGRQDNYFLEPELLEQYFCKTQEQSIKSIDRLIENNERFIF